MGSVGPLPLGDAQDERVFRRGLARLRPRVNLWMSAFTFAAAQLLRVLPRRRVSRAMGRLADHQWSPPVGRAVVKVYSRLYAVDFDECNAVPILRRCDIRASDRDYHWRKIVAAMETL